MQTSIPVKRSLYSLFTVSSDNWSQLYTLRVRDHLVHDVCF